MEIVADLHIHSHYSRATGKQLNPEHLDLWAAYKGVHVLGSGDCTHPGWLAELAAKLIPAAEGVYTLRPELRLPRRVSGPRWDAVPPVRFLVTGEISSIYKKNGRTRKVHTLVLLPSLEAATRLCARLGRLGNVTSDGRPILGLDARHLLEVVLEVDPDALVIPAHIWTPWFSVLGSRSGFDSLEECYDNLIGHIYALETGLSSDPAMNWRLSHLDRFVLVSNSDAHSPPKIAREANLFTVAPTYPALTQALKTRTGFAGTLEFFPDEGKYHLDGHRKCGQRLDPAVTRQHRGLCPACGKPVTLGVLHRVLELADRPPDHRPEAAAPFQPLIPLPEILAEVHETGPASKKVDEAYFTLLSRLGPELAILRTASPAALESQGGPLVARAIAKMRQGQVHIQGGYDGEYGHIRLFDPGERQELARQSAFWKAPPVPAEASEPPPPPPEPSAGEVAPPSLSPPAPAADPILHGLNTAQLQAVTHTGGPLLVQAGPGTGKTRALTHRVAHLLHQGLASPDQILALTFTRQAAGELRQRLAALLPSLGNPAALPVMTFHALGAEMLRDQQGAAVQVLTEDERRTHLAQAAQAAGVPLKALDQAVTAWKQELLYPPDIAPDHPAASYLEAYRLYQDALTALPAWDYDDLVALPVRLLEKHPDILAHYRQRWPHLLVDEYQDLNQAQYRFLKLLAGPGAPQLFAIGDPQQAIYGFRGARPQYFHAFQQDWPTARLIHLEETYRLPPPILAAASRALTAAGASPAPLVSRQPGTAPVLLLESSSVPREAARLARTIEALVGGTSHLALEDLRLRHQDPDHAASFRDIAILYRFHAVGEALLPHLAAAGIPCQQARQAEGPEITGVDLLAEKVTLLTLHAAKGLEFPYVFIIGCEAGLIPYEPSDGSADPAEEARLFYVGLTRASRQLFLSCVRHRPLWGQRGSGRLSTLAAAVQPEKDPAAWPAGSPAHRPGRQKGLFDPV